MCIFQRFCPFDQYSINSTNTSSNHNSGRSGKTQSTRTGYGKDTQCTSECILEDNLFTVESNLLILLSALFDIWYFIYIPWIHNKNKQDIEHVKGNTCNKCLESKKNNSKSSTDMQMNTDSKFMHMNNINIIMWFFFLRLGEQT